MGTIIKGTLVVVASIVLLVVIGYIGVTVWSCATGGQNPDQPDIPKVDEAAYSVYIENTGNLVYTDDYEQFGNKVGSRLFILHGFWELIGQSFKYRATDIPLDEGIFGEITVRRR